MCVHMSVSLCESEISLLWSAHKLCGSYIIIKHRWLIRSRTSLDDIPKSSCVLYARRLLDFKHFFDTLAHPPNPRFADHWLLEIL